MVLNLKRISKLIFTLVVGVALLFTATACNKDNKDGKLSRDQVYTSITESCKLDLNPTGKSFLTDGIGNVKLATVSDGDTASFLLPNGGTIRVRFYGIDTPESTGEVNKWGVDASTFTKTILGNATEFALESSDGGPASKDSYTRYLGFVWYRNSPTDEWKNMNLQLVENGYTKNNLLKVEDSKYYSYFNQAETFAKEGKLRIWGEDEDPLYSTEALDVNIKELLDNSEAYWNGENGKKVHIEAIITGLSVAPSGTHLFKATQIIDGKVYSYNVYTGYTGAAATAYLKIGNKYSMTGYVQFFNGEWQISGLKYVLMETGPDYTYILETGSYVLFDSSIQYTSRYANNLKTDGTITNAKLEGTTLTLEVSAKHADTKKDETFVITVTVDAGFDANSVVNKTLVGGVYLSGKGSSKTYTANKMSVSGDKVFVS